MSPELLVVVGPTASGKTELAVRLAEAFDGEIVSADSVQVYTRFQVGTGKPTAEERARARHHLIDVVEPDQPMDAAQWAVLADAAIDAIRSRGKTPIVCGGTFLWVRALLWGLAATPPGDAAIRRAHEARAAAEGRAALHAELARVDPASAVRLNANDFVRVSRALEVFELSGVTLSEWHAAHQFRQLRHPHRLIGVRHDPAVLDARIAARVAVMLESGWIAEVERLVVDGFGGARAMSSVGYKQVHEAVTSGDPTELAERITRATRVFARRQRTWLRSQPVRWLGAEAAASGDLRGLVAPESE